MLSFFSKKWKQAQGWVKTAAFEAIQSSLFMKESVEQPICKILCVDDDRSFCLFMQSLAHSLGIQLDMVGSMTAAKQLIEGEPCYKAFIIDGHLPDGSGFELVSWIREAKKLNTPIGFISRIYQDSKSFRLLKEGLRVDYVLEKPIQPLEVHHLLQQFCHLSTQSSDQDPFSDALLADLKVSYQNTIPDKIERLEKMILTLQKEPTRDNLQALKGEVHKIAGSAGSYGYAAVSELCKNLEIELIKQIEIAKNSLVDHQWLISLDGFFTQIKLYFQIEIPDSSHQSTRRSQYLPSVYVVDEDPQFLNTLTPTNQDLRFDILTEERPEKAIQTLFSADFYPQILLLQAHYQSSVLTGYELIQAFYQKNDYLTTVVALMVKEQALDEHVEALKKGMSFVLTKPFHMPLLLPLLDQTPFRALPFQYKILVVDDDLDICHYILKTLKYLGIDALAIQDFHELENKLKTYQPDLIVLDINLTDDSGIRVLEHLRQKLDYQKLLVGMLTVTEPDMHLIHKCYEAKVDEILFKPLEGGILQRKIAYLLKKQAEETLDPTLDPITGLANSATFKRYVQALQRQFQAPFPKILVLFEIESFAFISSRIKKEILTTATKALDNLLKKYEVAAYLGGGLFALIFQGYDHHFIQLFMQEFLLHVHSNLQPLLKNKNLRLNECLLFLSAKEKFDDLLQRGEDLLQVAQEQKTSQPIRLQTEKSAVKHKEVVIFYDETQAIEEIKQLFKTFNFKITLFSTLEEGFPQSLVTLPLIILMGSLARAKGLHLLKQLFLHNPAHIPILYLSQEPDVQYLGQLLDEVNYFEAPFGMVIFMTKVTEKVDEKNEKKATGC